jgi:4-amino-4-deoxychorismate lyase
MYRVSASPRPATTSSPDRTLACAVVATLAIVRPDGPQLADPAVPQIRVDDLGVLRGECVFETLRVIAGGPVDLDRHLNRLAHSAASVDVELPTADEFAAAAWLAIRSSGMPDGVLRLVATKGSDTAAPVRYAYLAPLAGDLIEPRIRGISARTLTLGIPAALRKDAPWLLGGVKSTSYAVAMAGQRVALDGGDDDAIWISSDGEVLEGTTSNVLAVIDGALVTPPPAELGLLPGLTLARLQDVAAVAERRITVAELAAAQEVLLASSVRGVVPVIRLDGVDRKIGAAGRELPAALEERLRAVAAAALPGPAG